MASLWPKSRAQLGYLWIRGRSFNLGTLATRKAWLRGMRYTVPFYFRLPGIEHAGTPLLSVRILSVERVKLVVTKAKEL